MNLSETRIDNPEVFWSASGEANLRQTMLCVHLTHFLVDRGHNIKGSGLCAADKEQQVVAID